MDNNEMKPIFVDDADETSSLMQKQLEQKQNTKKVVYRMLKFSLLFAVLTVLSWVGMIGLADGGIQDELSLVLLFSSIIFGVLAITFLVTALVRWEKENANVMKVCIITEILILVAVEIIGITNYVTDTSEWFRGLLGMLIMIYGGGTTAVVIVVTVIIKLIKDSKKRKHSLG